jgi:hypothetical protein
VRLVRFASASSSRVRTLRDRAHEARIGPATAAEVRDVRAVKPRSHLRKIVGCREWVTSRNSRARREPDRQSRFGQRCDHGLEPPQSALAEERRNVPQAPRRAHRTAASSPRARSAVLAQPRPATTTRPPPRGRRPRGLRPSAPNPLALRDIARAFEGPFTVDSARRLVVGVRRKERTVCRESRE